VHKSVGALIYGTGLVDNKVAPDTGTLSPDGTYAANPEQSENPPNTFNLICGKIYISALIRGTLYIVFFKRIPVLMNGG
jgi:hypothetical protein